MYDRIVVTLDGSEEAARALRPASVLARYLDVQMEAIGFHDPGDSGMELERRLAEQVAACGDLKRSHRVAPMDAPVADLTAAAVADHPNALIVMSTRGHGRTAALVGSVATEVLRTTHRPVMLVGPECDVANFHPHGDMFIAADSGEGTDDALELAAGMIEAFDYRPVLLNVVSPEAAAELARLRSGPAASDVPDESAMVHRFARQLGRETHEHDIDFRVLHGKTPGKAIAEHAEGEHPALILMATHARTGFGRLTAGSDTAAVVGRVQCPVLAVAPVDLTDE